MLLELEMAVDDLLSDAIDEQRSSLIQLKLLIYVHFEVILMVLMLQMSELWSTPDKLPISVRAEPVNERILHLHSHSMNLEKDASVKHRIAQVGNKIMKL